MSASNSPKSSGNKGPRTPQSGQPKKPELDSHRGGHGKTGGANQHRRPSGPTSPHLSSSQPHPTGGVPSKNHQAHSDRERNVPVPPSILANSFLHAIGQMATVTLRNGEKWSGVFHGAQVLSKMAPSPAYDANESNKKHGIILRMATKLSEDGSSLMEQPTEALFIKDEEFTALRFQVPRRATKGFQTDTEISSTSTVAADRQLTAWAPDAATPNLSFALSEKRHVEGAWNQFEANATMINAAATPYSEDLYTTPLDKTSDFYKTRIAEAARLAQEIESNTFGSTHNLEERGQKIQDDGMDEEDRYSMVLGAGARGKPGSYVVPALRAQSVQTGTNTAAGPSNGSSTNGPSNGTKRSTTNTNANVPGSPKQSPSSPLLRGLDLADDSSTEKKNFQPFSLDPTKTVVPNTATRSEDTAKLKKSSSELDEKVKAKADSSTTGGAKPSSGDSAAPAKKLSSKAAAWAPPGQRLLDSLGGSGTPPIGAPIHHNSSPVTSPLSSVVNTGLIPPMAINPTPMLHHNPAMMLPHNPMLHAVVPGPVHQPQSVFAQTTGFARHIRLDVDTRPISDIYQSTFSHQSTEIRSQMPAYGVPAGPPFGAPFGYPGPQISLQPSMMPSHMNPYAQTGPPHYQRQHFPH